MRAEEKAFLSKEILRMIVTSMEISLLFMDYGSVFQYSVCMQF
jgi:hypothetical protein